MKTLTLDILDEIMDYIQHLDDIIGLDWTTVADVRNAIEEYKYTYLKK